MGGISIRWLLWAAGITGVLVALALEAQYAAGAADCLLDAADQLALCAGPLPGWVVPATLAGGLLLTAVAWRIALAAD